MSADPTPHPPTPAGEPGRPLVDVAGVHKRFGEVEVLKGIDFTAAAGTVTVLIGPSGSGKTTVLRCLNALEIADAGVVTVGSVSVDYAAKPRKQELTRLRGQSAMVFQPTTCSRTSPCCRT